MQRIYGVLWSGSTDAMLGPIPKISCSDYFSNKLVFGLVTHFQQITIYQPFWQILETCVPFSIVISNGFIQVTLLCENFSTFSLIIPYPPPNVQLSIYVLFEIYRKLINQPVAQRFATVCEDFENAAIEEERHLKIIACRRAKIVHNDIYDAYLEITSERKDFFNELRCANATKMVLSNRVLSFDTILEDFPKLKRLILLNCIIAEEELPRNKQYNNISDLEVSGATAFRLWQSIAVLFPHVQTVNLTDASLENPLGMEMLRILRFKDNKVFQNIRRFSVIGSILCDEDVEFLANLTNLESLSIIRNSKVTGIAVWLFIRNSQEILKRSLIEISDSVDIWKDCGYITKKTTLKDKKKILF